MTRPRRAAQMRDAGALAPAPLEPPAVLAALCKGPAARQGAAGDMRRVVGRGGAAGSDAESAPGALWFLLRTGGGRAAAGAAAALAVVHLVGSAGAVLLTLPPPPPYSSPYHSPYCTLPPPRCSCTASSGSPTAPAPMPSLAARPRASRRMLRVGLLPPPRALTPSPPPPPPSRTKWTLLVHPSVLIGHVSSLWRARRAGTGRLAQGRGHPRCPRGLAGGRRARRGPLSLALAPLRRRASLPRSAGTAHPHAHLRKTWQCHSSSRSPQRVLGRGPTYTPRWAHPPAAASAALIRLRPARASTPPHMHCQHLRKT